MAFQDLTEGQCGGPSSLIRLTTHFVQDHGFKDEGFQHTFGHAEQFEPTNSEQLVKQFLEESAVHPQTFRMDNLLQGMCEIEHTVNPPVSAPGVIREITGLDTAWANQYLESGRHFDENHADDIWNSQVDSIIPQGQVVDETHEFGLGPKWAEEYLEHSVDNLENDDDKTCFPQRLDNSSSEDANVAYSKFMKFMKQEGDIPIESSQDLSQIDDKWSEEYLEDTKNEDRSIAKEDVLNKVEEELAVAGKWVEEFSKESSKTKDGDNYEATFWNRLQEEWEKVTASEEVSAPHPWISEYAKYYDPFKEYTFHNENPMKDISEPLEEGKRRLEAGDLPSAVLCFEVAVQQEPKNANAWLLLGKTQAENEQDPLAISALKECLTLDPSNSTALMALAVSYTNESYQNQACLTLKEWLLKNEKYKHLVQNRIQGARYTESGVSTVLFHDIHNEVRELFIEAARMNPHETIDPDVQCGLGVLFNLSSEYDKAADCFRTALQVIPDDSRLWNRLGATLANGQSSEEAVDAYHEALKLSPGFIRARYNLGISCINLGAYKEAGEHLLTALNQQAASHDAYGRNGTPMTMSDTIWSTLRLVISLMHKYHLNEAIEQRDLRTLNKEFDIE
ncbi:peroxisomal targeting signal 1 receptor [Cephus cinctus]|uniref:Peroxisomal targeting signal 1 receptor n=1 Tax=Cephus cinctus TaxID=211228 RepID=A0AAJ7C545_CEPCN|nr:peroxisomal targeting signal 1 receptor [Cephus cinctus]XP_024944087.1 peroxisomal targeting signal 1 receptor [Cephus cinctus]